jgi:general secretion pathway protein A
MYTAFYGLREKPFTLLPDPRYLFLADSHREALAHLLYGIDQAEGFICITGEVGTGKTTLCRTLLDRLGGETEVAFLFNPSQSGIELLQDIHAELGLESIGRSRSDLTGELNHFLMEKKREQRRVLLIIDEAQNLSENTLEQVRLLSNLETQSSKLIQILLLGQPELDRKLDSQELRQLRQRISVRWQLHPLTAKETRAYVRHRLQVAAGAERELFTDGALREIHRRSGGVPRRINVLCDRVLLAGYVARAPRVSAAIVRQAAKEIPDASRRRSSGVGKARAGDLAGAALRKLGAGAVFAAGLVLGLAVAGGLMVGVDGPLRERIAPWLAQMGVAPDSTALPQVSEPSGDLALLGDAPDSVLETTSDDVPATGSATVLIGNPAAFASQTLDPVDPDRADQMSSAALDGLAAGAFLGAVIDTTDPDLARLDAMNAVLESYGEDAILSGPVSDELAVAWLEERGLSVLPVEDAELDSLRGLNHPALLRLRGSYDDTRLVALTRLDGDLAAIHGLAEAGPLWVPLDELLQQWDGEAWVVWNDFESIRPVLAFGEQGHSVSWLQAALAELGYYVGEPSGLFDRDTREGLRSFQRAQRLLPDGMAGPRTRMVLYQQLQRYAVPRLVVEPGAEEGAG